jgi:DNA polymerase III sliding clamp (beta) subunit (PCNA family)
MLTNSPGIVVSLPIGDLFSALCRTKHSMPSDESRYYLNGVYVHPYNVDKLAFVSTDGHRLTRILVDAPGCWGMPAVILPRDFVCSVITATRIKTFHEHIATLTVSSSKVTLSAVGHTLECTPIDGTYPDYVKVLPKASEAVPFCFNSKYIAEMAKSAGGDKITCYLNDPYGPNGFTSKEDELFIVMPMRS